MNNVLDGLFSMVAGKAAALGGFALFSCVLPALLCGGFCVALAETSQPAAAPTSAEDKWNVELASHPAGPSRFLAVDKIKQQLYLLEQRSPLTVRDSYFCSTGERPGDKQYEGDLKTPEGVYFVQSRLDGGLDFQLYGDLAFTLDFPNPVDKIKGKTGSGIWIHGRGHQLTTRETKGCMALANNDLHALDPLVERGTPVVIAGNVQWTGGRMGSDVPDELVGKVRSWADTWQNKSESFFDYYDQDRFAKGQGRPFNAFRDHKENLFQRLPWITVMVSDVRVLPGPDYWVTYFGQLYRSSSLVSEGMKRLYWMPDENGDLRIVGEEWEPLDLGLEAQYVHMVGDKTVAFIESWRNAWENGDLDSYMDFYDKDADQGSRRGKASIKEHKVELWRDKQPLMVGIDDLDISMHADGVKVSFIQKYRAKGFKDKGLKTLFLKPEGDSWKIVSENWSAL